MPPGERSRALEFDISISTIRYATERFCVLSVPVPMGNQLERVTRDRVYGAEMDRHAGHKKWGQHFFHAVIQVTLASWPVRKRLEVGRTSRLQSKSDALIRRGAHLYLYDARRREGTCGRQIQYALEHATLANETSVAGTLSRFCMGILRRYTLPILFVALLSYGILCPNCPRRDNVNRAIS